MQVYKAFFKIIFKNLSQIMIYIVIFIFLTAFLANTNDATNTDFTETRVNIAVINHDSDTVLVEGLRDYLAENSNMINIPDDTKELQDALFYRKVEYIVTVPDGFSSRFLSENPLQLEKTTIPGSAKSVFFDTLINKYLNTARTYLDNMGNLSRRQLLNYISQDLSQETVVKVNTSGKEPSKNESLSYYFNYMAYSLYAVLILGVSSVMMVFNDPDLKRRNLCSPVKLHKINLQLILGNLTFSVVVWFILIFMSFVMYGNDMFTGKGLLLLLNSFIFTFTVLSISYLIGNVIKSKGAMSAAANVVALGTSFISGVFVPQALLGKTVLKIASFTPNFWYVKSNNSIVSLANFNMKNLTPIFLNMLVLIGFAAALLSITVLLTKQQRMSN